MSDKIAEGNRLIAEFLGKKVTESYIDAAFSDDLWCVRELRYHESWDWLMPVVEKISKHHLRNWDNTECTEDIDTCYPVTFNMPDKEGNVMFRFKGFSLHEGKSLIDITWQAVIEFIQFHNNQTPQQ